MRFGVFRPLKISLAGGLIPFPQVSIYSSSSVPYLLVFSFFFFPSLFYCLLFHSGEQSETTRRVPFSLLPLCSVEGQGLHVYRRGYLNLFEPVFWPASKDKSRTHISTPNNIIFVDFFFFPIQVFVISHAIYTTWSIYLCIVVYAYIGILVMAGKHIHQRPFLNKITRHPLSFCLFFLAARIEIVYL